MKTALIILGYRICLDWIYENWICIYYGYYGFKGELSVVGYIESIVFLVIGTALMKLNNKASSIVLHFIYLMYFVPFTCMIAFDAFDDYVYKYLYMSYWVILNYGYRIINNITLKEVRISKVIDVNRSKTNLFWFYLMVVGICLNILFIGVFYTGFHFTFNLYEIYDMRRAIGDIKLPILSEYLLSACKLSIPVIIFVFHNMNKIIYMWLTVVLCFITYGILALKSMLFIAMLSLIMISIKTDYKKQTVTTCAFIACSLGIAEFCFSDTHIIIEIFIRRMLFWTNLLTYQYYDYFCKVDPDYFRSSFLRLFGFTSEYSQTSIVHTIGVTYYGREISANCGLLADAFANLGILGVAIMPIVILFLLYILDRCTYSLPINILFLPCLIIASHLINTFLTIALLTHGVIISLIIFKISQGIVGIKRIEKKLC